MNFSPPCVYHVKQLFYQIILAFEQPYCLVNLLKRGINCYYRIQKLQTLHLFIFLIIDTKG